MTNNATIEQPVRRLQEMLHTLSFYYPQLPQLDIDGIFGERTLESVMIFQRDFFPPVTGVVNNATWQAIQNLYRSHRASAQLSRPFLPIPDSIFPIQPGTQLPQMQLVQTMLDSLSAVLSDLEPTEHDGTLHGATQADIRALQTACRLPPSGILDLQTWSCLTRLYRMFITPIP